MKILASVFLIFILLIQINFKSVFITVCEVNKSYIATYLCINKSNPKSCCKGKCFVSKSLKAQNDLESKLPFQLKTIDEIVFLIQSNIAFEQLVSSDFKLATLRPYFLKIYQSPSQDIIQPPA